MNLRQLEYFRAVASQGTFTGAALQLGVAQPTLTKSIHALESELGTRLFERLPRGVALTPAGEVLYRHARRVDVQLQDAREEMTSLSMHAPSEVILGAGPSWLRRLLPEAVASVQRSNPALHVRVVGGFDNVLLKGLRAGELDFVVLELPPRDEAKDLALEQLTTDKLGVFARQGHPLAGRRRNSLTALLDYPWAMSPKSTRPQQRLNAIFVSAGLPPPRITVETDSVAFLLRLVSQTDALTFTVTSTAAALDAGGTVQLAVPDIRAERAAGIITRKEGWIAPAALAIIKELRQLSSVNTRN